MMGVVGRFVVGSPFIHGFVDYSRRLQTLPRFSRGRSTRERERGYIVARRELPTKEERGDDEEREKKEGRSGEILKALYAGKKKNDACVESEYKYRN